MILDHSKLIPMLFCRNIWDNINKVPDKMVEECSYVFGSASKGNTSRVGTRCKTPTFKLLASERKVSPLDKGTSKPPSPVVAGEVIGTGAIIFIPFCTNFSIHDICNFEAQRLVLEAMLKNNYFLSWGFIFTSFPRDHQRHGGSHVEKEDKN